MIFSSQKGKFSQLMNCNKFNTSLSMSNDFKKAWHMTTWFSRILLKGRFFTHASSRLSSRVFRQYCDFRLTILYDSPRTKIEDFFLQTWHSLQAEHRTTPISTLSAYYSHLCVLAVCASSDLRPAQLWGMQPDGDPVVALWGSLQWKY